MKDDTRIGAAMLGWPASTTKELNNGDSFIVPAVPIYDETAAEEYYGISGYEQVAELVLPLRGSMGQYRQIAIFRAARMALEWSNSTANRPEALATRFVRKGTYMAIGHTSLAVVRCLSFVSQDQYMNARYALERTGLLNCAIVEPADQERTVVIGREASLAHEFGGSELTSRAHCTLEFGEDSFTVTDHSTNGTRVILASAQ